MNKKQKISLAIEIRNLIATYVSDTWPGFTPVPFILYDDKNQVALGNEWPDNYSQEQECVWVAQGFDPLLIGNTSMIYHNVRVAIWDTRTWPDSPDVSKATSSIAHEMFHAFQQMNMNLPWANELLLPQYPHNKQSVAFVIEENKWLAEVLKSPDSTAVGKCLRNISVLRGQREAEIGADCIEYDKRCESIEGTAAYVEIRMNALVEGITTFKAASSYLPMLMDSSKLLNNYRHRCYAAGLVLCLASDVMWGEWQEEWSKSGKTIFDCMKDKMTLTESVTTISLSDLEAADELLTAYQKEKEQIINAFTAQPLTSFEGAIQLTGFDPMNLVCTDGRCLHNHGKLRFGKTEKMITGPFLEEYGATIIDVKRIFIPNTTVSSHADSRLNVEGLGEMNGNMEQSQSGICCIITE